MTYGHSEKYFVLSVFICINLNKLYYNLNKIFQKIVYGTHFVQEKTQNYRFLFSLKGNALWVRFVYGACAHQFTVGFWQKMASAKFLEEALSSTDVDESAVNALVGSLEDQLVTTAPAGSNQQATSVTVNQNHMTSSISNGGTVTTQKHGVSNGGPESMNIIVNNDGTKVIPNAAHQSGNSISTSVVNTVVTSLQGGVPSSGFLNQVNSNIGLVQSNLTNLNKSQESVKLVYPSNSQAVTTSVGVNINSRVSYANQSSTSLPNGNIGLTAHTGLNASSGVQSIVTQSYSQAGSNVNKQIGGVVGMDQNKPTGTALVIKSSGNTHGPQGTQLSAGVVSVPMTVNTTMTLTGSHVNTSINTSTTPAVPGVVTLAKSLNQPVGSQPTIVGNNPTTLIPANVQILNLRAGTPGQPGQKTLPPRVMIGAPQVVGARPGQPGQITLQTLQGLQPGTQGHLLVKTENGQYQLLRVGPATTPTAAIAPNNAANTAFRVQSVPAVGGTTAGTIQTQVPALSGTTQSTTTPANAQPARHTMDTTKEKCRKFLANLLELSSREPKAVERNVRTLIQELVDTKVEPEEFCDRLERLLNASPQPCLIGFLKKSLPLLRQSMVNNELVIDGIRPPPRSVVFSMTSTTPTVVQPQIQQPANQTTVGLTNVRPQVQMTTTPQMRVIAHPGTALGATTTTRPAQPIQHRIVTKYLQPMRIPPPVTKVMTATSGMGTVSASGLRPTTVVGGGVAARITTPVRPPAGGTAIIKTPTGTLAAQLKPGQTLAKATLPTRPASLSTTAIVTSASPVNKTHTSSFLLKAVTSSKEKEKKSYSSTAGGYTGDDDINDVAAMGGVNLAEETQRILGSTEFVGTQIRSCKDDLYLHSTPLVQKISQIASRHGLEEPASDVAALVSHATQERLKTLVEKLAVIAEHRIDLNKADPQYEVCQDVRGQLKFLEELDRVERKRHEEQERELLLRAAKSRSKSEDPEQAKLKAKAKEMQRAEMEELRQREANLTALQAIGSRKKPKLDNSDNVGSSGQLPSRPRLKRVNLRDLLFLLEQEKDTCRSNLLYRAHLK